MVFIGCFFLLKYQFELVEFFQAHHCFGIFFLGITPFPYKVAKALDENIYRNVEFDSWNECRHLDRARKNYFKVSNFLTEK